MDGGLPKREFYENALVVGWYGDVAGRVFCVCDQVMMGVILYFYGLGASGIVRNP